MDLVKAWGWKSFTIIYENNEGLVRLQELLKAHGPYEFPITVRQLGEGNDYRLYQIPQKNVHLLSFSFLNQATVEANQELCRISYCLGLFNPKDL